MQKYLRIYHILLRLNFSALVTYRTNFFNAVIGSFVWGVFSMVSVLLLTSRTPFLFGWKREEIVLLTGVYSLFIGIFHFAFSRNFERIPIYVRLGTLDAMLLKPLDTQFFVSIFLINFASIIRIIIGSLVIWYLLAQTQTLVTISSIILFLLFLSAGIVLLYSLWFMVTTITIWYPDLSNIVEFLFSFSNVGRYPREMFARVNRFVFFFLLPLTFIVETPLKGLLDKLAPLEIGGLIGFASLFFLISRIFWKFALRHYTSASS